jgi:hypothetical protein
MSKTYWWFSKSDFYTIVERGVMDIKKLPKWAQEHIARLERTVERLEREVKESTEEYKEGMFWQYGLDRKVPIPEGATVHFPSKINHQDITLNSKVSIHRAHHEGNEWLRISGDTTIIILPMGANNVFLKAVDHTTVLEAKL